MFNSEKNNVGAKNLLPVQHEKNKERVQENADTSVQNKKELNASAAGAVAVSLGYLALLGYIVHRVTKDDSKKECCNQNYSWL